jgi:4'-phosphopantetheinyl transferase
MSADASSHAARQAGPTAAVPLLPGEIHVWLAFEALITDERLHAAYRQLLDAAERAQEPRFYFARDRRRYLITRALVRTVLSRYVPIGPRDWVFSTNAYGRPEIANAEAAGAGLSFNISHTPGLVVLAVATRRALGVDVEDVDAREAPLDIADRFFAAEEVSALAAAPPSHRQYRFFEYWTFKESYIKARGMGLSLPLDRFSFHYADDRAVEIAIRPELADDPARWQFWQFRPRPEYLVAICAERIAAGQPRPIVRQIVPLRHEEVCAHEFLRVSRSGVNTASERERRN